MLVPRVFGYTPYNVTSESMSDIYPVGGMIFVRHEAPENIVEGDIITFAPANGEVITHTVKKININKQFFITKGNMNDHTETVAFSELIGKASSFSLPLCGAIASFILSAFGKILLILLIIADVGIFYFSKKLTINAKHE